MLAQGPEHPDEQARVADVLQPAHVEVVAGGLAGSLLALFAVSRTWGVVTAPQSLTIDRLRFEQTGSSVAGPVSLKNHNSCCSVPAIATSIC